MATDSIDLAEPASLTAHLAAELAAAVRARNGAADRRAAAALDVTIGVPGAERRYRALNGAHERALADIKRLQQARKGADARRAGMDDQTACDANAQQQQSIDALVEERRAVIAKVEKQMAGLLDNLKQADELATRIVALRGPLPDFPSNLHPEGLGPVPARERIRRAAVGMGLGDWLGIKAAFIDATQPVASLVALEEHAMSFSRIADDTKAGKEAAA